MPDLTIETVTMCPMYASNFQVNSSKGDADYLVQFTSYAPPTCSCKSFQYSGDFGEQTCKHIRKVKVNGCFYNPQLQDAAQAWNEFNFDDNNIKWLSQSPDTVGQPCPGCGCDMIAVRVAV